MSLDTETTGLRIYHADRLFSIILSDGVESFYFNFQGAFDIPSDCILTPWHLNMLKSLLFWEPDKTWYMHNATFDMAVLAKEGIELAGRIHCTKSIARVVFNDHPKGTYGLSECGERIGLKKDDRVDAYIADNGLWTWINIPGKKKRDKHKHYDRVPFPLITEYGAQDANVCFHLGKSQEKVIEQLSEETLSHGEKLPTLRNIQSNERRLTKTIHRIQNRGVRIDQSYCVRAMSYESDRARKSEERFQRETGRAFAASGKLFQEVFASEKDKWGATEKGNPSFKSEYLKTFENPAAKAVVEYTDAKSKADFYAGFLYHADADDIVHPHFDQGGCNTGRFSSSSPNFQNLTSEEDEELNQEFVVRRAIIPRDGFILYGRDWSAMEYRLLFEYAARMLGRETEMIKLIKYQGMDPHQATADLVTALGRMKLTRRRAKNGNFGYLYGSGLKTLAATIGGTVAEARALKDAISEIAPELDTFIRTVKNTALQRGYIRNWFGRRSYLIDPNFAYGMPNRLIQGGCADINKIALNHIDEFLLNKKSKLILTIHDEAVLELSLDEVKIVPPVIKQIMETVFPAQYLPLISSGYIGDKNLADLEEYA